MLDQELAYFDSHKDDLLKHYEGQFVLVHGDQLLGAFSTEQLAYQAALEKVGNVPVLIRRVRKEAEPIDSIPALLVGLTGAGL